MTRSSSFVLSLFLLAIVGCTSEVPTEEGEDSLNEADRKSTDSTPSVDKPADATPTTDPATTTPNATNESGPSGTSDPQTSPPPPLPSAAACDASAKMEVEPNDTRDLANELGDTQVFCGSIKPILMGHGVGGDTCMPAAPAPADACKSNEKLISFEYGHPCVNGTGYTTLQWVCSAPDVDHVAFTLPKDAKAMSFSASFTKAKANVVLTVDGVEVPAGASMPFTPGARYDFAISSAEETDYALGVKIVR